MSDDSLYSFRLSEFGASEVSRITGVSPELQRDWRRRGILAIHSEGPARFYTPHLAQMLVRRELQLVGIPLTASIANGLIGSISVEAFACAESGAIEFDHDVPSDVRVEATKLIAVPSVAYLVVRNPPLSADAIKSLAEREKVQGALDEIGPVWPAYNWADVQQILGNGHPAATSIGVVDLQALGRKLARTAERCLVTVAMGSTGTKSPTSAMTSAALQKQSNQTRKVLTEVEQIAGEEA